MIREDLAELQSSGPFKIRYGNIVWLCVYVYVAGMFFATLGTVLYQEGTSAKRPLGKWIRTKLGHNDFHRFLAT